MRLKIKLQRAANEGMTMVLVLIILLVATGGMIGALLTSRTTTNLMGAISSSKQAKLDIDYMQSDVLRILKTELATYDFQNQVREGSSFLGEAIHINSSQESANLFVSLHLPSNNFTTFEISKIVNYERSRGVARVICTSNCTSTGVKEFSVMLFLAQNNGDTLRRRLSISLSPGATGGADPTPSSAPAETLPTFVESAAVNMTFMKSADLNGDGYMDIVGITSAGIFTVYLADGHGAFTSPFTYDFGISKVGGSWTSYKGFELADMNGDGRPDVVAVASGSDTAKILKGNGNGTFGNLQLVVSDKAFESVSVADVDHNGTMDIVSSESGGGLFTRTRYYNSFGLYSSPVSTKTGTKLSQMQMVDVNGDGYPDLISCSRSSSDTISYTMSVGLNASGTGLFNQTAYTWNGGSGSCYGLQVVDVDKDGRLDIVLQGQKASAVAANMATENSVVFSNSGNGAFAAAKSLVTGDDTIYGNVVDYDADGNMDIVRVQGYEGPSVSNVTSNPYTRVLLYKGTGNSFSSTGTVLDDVKGQYSESSLPIVQDFNKDGKRDIAFSRYNVVPDANSIADYQLRTLFQNAASATDNSDGPVPTGSDSSGGSSSTAGTVQVNFIHVQNMP
jgi:hypothetical protein